jgi:hypothetical protein
MTRFKEMLLAATGFMLVVATLEAGNVKLETEPSMWQGTPAPSGSSYASPDKQIFKTVVFKGPGKWGLKTAGLNLDSTKRIFLRLLSEKDAVCTLSFRSTKGSFKRQFDLNCGEQVKIIPVGAFTRNGESPSWSSIDEVVLEIESSAAVQLADIECADTGSNLPSGKNIWLLKGINAVNHVGTAWPLYAIIDGTVYPKRVENAGASLSSGLKRLFDISLPVNPKDFKGGRDNVILVGREAVLKAGTVSEDELKKEGFNGFVVRVKDGGLSIAGGSLQGIIYGVYKYLERNGLKFFANDVYTIKKSSENTLEALDFEGRPFFNGRRISGPFCIYGESAAIGDPTISGIDAEYPCDKTQWIDHTAGFLVPKKLYLKEHPEYYILRGDGTRITEDTPDVRLMVCQTNPGGIKVAAERAMKWIEKQKEKKYFVIQQGDDMEACMCNTCKAKRAEGWNEADLMLNWVNGIAAEVAKKYPDKTLLCYAYVSTQPPPNKLKPARNVNLLYCPWPTKISAPNGFRDFDATENIIAGTEINGWIKKCGAENLGIYDYNAYASLSMHGMADRVKWCARNGMKGGFWYCGTPTIFKNLFVYVHSQLNWDPFLDVRPLEKEFIKAYYGEAAPVMGKIIWGIFDRLDEDDRNNGRGPAPEFFSKEFTGKVLGWFDEAAKLAPEKLKGEIRGDKEGFVQNGVLVLRPVGRESSQEQAEVFGMFLKRYIAFSLEKHGKASELAGKQKKPVPGFEGIADDIWNLTHVRIDTVSLKEGEIPPMLAELAKDPVGTIKKHRITDFTKKLPDGVLIPAEAFSGAVGPTYYKWKCEGKVAAWVRGSMTDVSVMSATFALDGEPSGKSELEIEGQDSDKLWCPQAPIQIVINGKNIFEGLNGFVKHGWSKRTFSVPAGVLKKGENTITIRNLASSDSRTAYWFMISEAKLKNASAE